MQKMWVFLLERRVIWLQQCDQGRWDNGEIAGVSCSVTGPLFSPVISSADCHKERMWHVSAKENNSNICKEPTQMSSPPSSGSNLLNLTWGHDDFKTHLLVRWSEKKMDELLLSKPKWQKDERKWHYLAV